MTEIPAQVELQEVVAAQGGRREPRPGFYYVTIRDGARHGYLAGPYVDDLATALAAVDPIRRLAREVNREEATWAGFGVAWAPDDRGDGKLNRQLAEQHPELAPPSWKWWPAERLSPGSRVFHAHVGRGGHRERPGCNHSHRTAHKAEECAAQLAGRLNLERA
jgi:hypothetical protein